MSKKQNNGSLVTVGLLGVALGVIGALFLSKNKDEKIQEKEKESNIMDNQTISENDNLLCPISQTVMKDPVFLTCGHTYDRQNIENWLNKSNTCPLCNKKVNQSDLVPNYQLKSFLQDIHKK